MPQNATTPSQVPLTPESAVNDLSGHLQEDILTLLAFSDEHASYLTTTISPDLFKSAVYREIATRITQHIHQYKTPPKQHLVNILEDILTGEERKASLFRRTIEQMEALSHSINAQYVLNQVAAFVREQHIKVGVAQATRSIDAGNIDAAELALTTALKNRTDSFDIGTDFSDPNHAFDFLDSTDEDSYLTGITALDYYNVGPARKQLWTLMAGPGRGKSWGLMHMGKAALVQGLRVLHVTLELSERFTAQRYAQSLFGITTRAMSQVKLPVIQLDQQTRRFVTRTDRATQRPSMADRNIRAFLRKRHQQTLNDQLIIKEFPTNTLRMTGLLAYLDGLERSKRFTPDLLIVDYPDLMYKERDNMRLELQQIYENLRGLAVERNIAVAAATQSNRAGERVRMLTLEHLAEDFAKAGISDKIWAYGQTPTEYDLGLARLFIAKCRTDRQNRTILITQSYDIGQFCIQSAEFDFGQYFGYLDSIEASKTVTVPLPRRPQP